MEAQTGAPGLLVSFHQTSTIAFPRNSRLTASGPEADCRWFSACRIECYAGLEKKPGTTAATQRQITDPRAAACFRCCSCH